MERSSDKLAAALLAVLLLSLDLSLTSHFANFDGVACAMAVETANLRRLAHGNHVLYGLLGFAFDGLWRLLAYRGPALLSLSVLNRLLHAASGGLMYLLLRRLGAGRRGAVCGALGLSFSFAPWFYALEPQVYPLGLAALLAAALALFSPSPSPAAAGLWQALAVGGHATHIVWAPCALLWLKEREARRRYLAALGLGVLAVYLLGAWATQIKDGRDFLLWLEGTAAIGLDRRFRWNGSFHPLLWFKGLVLALWAPQGGWGSPLGPGWGLEALLAVVFAGLGFKAALSKDRRLAAALGLWLLGYLCFFSTWEPDNPNYHFGDLAAFWILAVLAFEDASGPRRWAPAALTAALIWLNFGLGIAPLQNPGSNPLLQQMRDAEASTPESSWLATDGGLGMVYVPYFAHRRPLVLRERPNHPEVFQLKDPVYVLPQVLSDPQWGPYLKENFKLAQAGSPAWPLYKLEALKSSR